MLALARSARFVRMSHSAGLVEGETVRTSADETGKAVSRTSASPAAGRRRRSLASQGLRADSAGDLDGRSARTHWIDRLPRVDQQTGQSSVAVAEERCRTARCVKTVEYAIAELSDGVNAEELRVCSDGFWRNKLMNARRSKAMPTETTVSSLAH